MTPLGDKPESGKLTLGEGRPTAGVFSQFVFLFGGGATQTRAEKTYKGRGNVATTRSSRSPRQPPRVGIIEA